MRPGELGRLRSVFGANVCNVVVTTTLGRQNFKTVFDVFAGTLVVFVDGPHRAQWSRSADNDVVRVFVIGHGFGYVHDYEFVPL